MVYDQYSEAKIRCAALSEKQLVFFTFSKGIQVLDGFLRYSELMETHSVAKSFYELNQSH